MLKRKFTKIATLSLVLTMLFSSNVLATTKTETKNINSTDNVSQQDESDLLNGKLSVDDFYKKYPQLKKQKDLAKKNLEANESADKLKESLRMNAAVSTYKGLSGTFNFFANNTNAVGGAQKWSPYSNVQKTGCGAVAACNIMAYHAREYGRTNLYPSSYWWTTDSFGDFETMMFNNFVPGVCDYIALDNGVKSYTSSRGYNYGSSKVSCWSYHSYTFTDLSVLIRNSINSNNPVALLIGANMPYNSYYPYNTDDFKTHWVTIVSYDINDPRYVQVSSWGELWCLDLVNLEINRTNLDVVSFYKS